MSVRERISLDGRWHLSPQDELFTSIEVPVPAPWQAVPELRDYSGVAEYQRNFSLPPGWLENRRIVLGFGAVDYLAQVWINDQLAGEHEGGYLPFELDITSLVRPGVNSLCVRVMDPPEIFAEIPHGKQSWYGQLSGIWQSVWLENRSLIHFSTLKITPHMNGKVEVDLRLNRELEAGSSLAWELLGPENEVNADIPRVASGQADTPHFSFKVDHPQLWDIDMPMLYRLQVSLQGPQGNLVDQVADDFGFRSFTAREGRLWLNGHLFYMRAALDQDYYPDLICTPPSQEYIESEFRQAKAMGLNCLRVHIKIADPRYYRAADRVGLLIWSELPNCKRLTPDSQRRLRQTLEGMVERDWNHPSLVIWSIINESWGIDLTDPAQRAWLLETFQFLKALDPYRLVVDNSACTPNFHLQSDIDDYHHYRLIPDHRGEWDQFIHIFTSRADWSFSQSGDALRTENEPLILSEFGNWGLPDPELLKVEGQEPWWFETGYHWLNGVVYPHGIQNRFKDYHLDKVFTSWKDFIAATQQQEFLSLKYEIESIQAEGSLSGYVITEFTDVHWECNGLLDMRRNAKSFTGRLPGLLSDTLILPRWERTAYWSGEEVKLEIVVAHWGRQPLPAGRIRWEFGETRGDFIETPAVSPGQVRTVGNLIFTAPEVSDALSQDFVVQWISGEGFQLATNFVPFVIFPERSERVSSPAFPSVWSDEAEILQRLHALGYTIAEDSASAGVILATRLDQAQLDYVRQGGNLLVFIDRPEDVGEDVLEFGVVKKAGSQWQGDWATTFTWLHRTGALARLPGGPLLDYAYEGVTPSVILTGFRPHEFETEVLAGTFVGWLQKNVAIVAKQHYSKGEILVTTFRLFQDAPMVDPAATSLLDALIEVTSGL